MDFRDAIITQYHAALEMLKQAILACPESLWRNPRDRNKLSQVAYHALFYTHMYLLESESAFQFWSGHREEYRLNSDAPTPPSETADRETVLDYLAFCQELVIAQISSMVPDAPSGFHWLPFDKFELQLYSIRHIQQHTGELMERLYARAGIELDWIGTYRAPLHLQDPH